MITRRHALLAGLATLALPARAQTAPELRYPYTLPPLPYAFNANEPSIDALTMELHHDKHHAAYVANLNAALKDYGQAAELPLPALLARVPELPETIRATVRNNGGGHANHTMFWTLMGGRGGEPGGDLAAAITRDLGGLEACKTAFSRAGLGQFGSGWAMILVDATGKLTIEPRPNQDSPLMTGQRVLLGNDVWEHAYYLKYQNRRADYLAAWWNVVDWPAIAQRYAAARAGTLGV